MHTYALIFMCISFITHCQDNANILRDIATGSCAGVAEGTLGVPCQFFKTGIQKGLTLSVLWHTVLKKHPGAPWTGFNVNASGMVPITVLQTIVHTNLRPTFENHMPKAYADMCAAIHAGVLAATVACPMERINYEQHCFMQKNNGSVQAPSMLKTAKAIIQNGGFKALMHGYSATAIRDGGFTGALFSGRNLLAPHIHSGDETVDKIGAGILVGILSSIVTQPFDSARTAQWNASSKYITLVTAIQELRKPQPIQTATPTDTPQFHTPGIFGGLKWRALRIALAIPVMGLVQDALHNIFTQQTQ